MPHSQTKPASPDRRQPEEEGDDIALVARIRAGQEGAWSDLIRRYQDRLFSVCLRMVHDRELAADLTQDAFVRVLQGLEGFDGRSKLSTWMIRITMNVCLSKLRSEKLRRHASLDVPRAGGRESRPDEGGSWGASLAAPAERGEPGNPQSVEGREERELVLRALQTLEPDQRAVLILCDCRGLPYEHIAEVLGVAVGTVKSRVFRARTALRDAVEEMGRKR